MQTSGKAVNIHWSQCCFDRINNILVDLTGVMVLQAIDYAGKTVDDATRTRYHVLVRHFGMVTGRHKTCDIGTKSPDTEAIFYASIGHIPLLCCLCFDNHMFWLHCTL